MHAFLCGGFCHTCERSKRQLNDVCKLYCNDSVERHSIFPRKRTINNESKLLDVVQIRKMSSHH